MCQPWTSIPRLPRGFSRLWSGPATKPSSEIDMWQVVSGIHAPSGGGRDQRAWAALYPRRPRTGRMRRGAVHDPEGHEHAIHLRTADGRRRHRARIHARRGSGHPVDARRRVGIHPGPADPDGPPRRASRDVSAARRPGPAARRRRVSRPRRSNSPGPASANPPPPPRGPGRTCTEPWPRASPSMRLSTGSSFPS